MTTKCKKVEVLTTAIDAELGSLARIYSAFNEAGVNVTASWAYEMGPGQANFHCYTTDNTKAKDVLTKMGKSPKAEFACWAEGDDKVGTYAELLQKIAKAGINLHATDALSTNGCFATVFFADQKDIPNLCTALGC